MAILEECLFRKNSIVHVVQRMTTRQHDFCQCQDLSPFTNCLVFLGVLCCVWNAVLGLAHFSASITQPKWLKPFRLSAHLAETLFDAPRPKSASLPRSYELLWEGLQRKSQDLLQRQRSKEDTTQVYIAFCQPLSPRAGLCSINGHGNNSLYQHYLTLDWCRLCCNYIPYNLLHSSQSFPIPHTLASFQ